MSDPLVLYYRRCPRCGWHGLCRCIDVKCNMPLVGGGECGATLEVLVTIEGDELDELWRVDL